MKKYFLIIMFFFLLFFLGEVTFGEEIKIKNSIRVTNNIIMLSDILKTDNKNILEKAKEVQIGYSPKVGEEKKIEKEYINLKIKQLNLDDKIKIKIPDYITITRNYQILTKKIFKYMVLEELNSIYKNSGFSLELKLDMNEELKLPVGNIKVKFGNNRLSDIKIGNYNFTVKIFVNDKVEKIIRTNLKVGILKEVYILNRDVKRNEKFSIEDVIKIKKIFINNYYSANIEGVNEIKGKLYRRNLRKGEILKYKDFIKEKIFKRNSLVTIYVDYNGIKLKATGKALEDGYIGDNIRVLNINSKKIINGIVTKEGMIKLEIK
ncbi:flagellar basal body P-ring formation chaperone FlgA [Haliovirga abyssi]|uniref:Flagella basal body P-ring formation protein FlgA SAF domain-containing protein n=1 Tax=Haliovirga abyssi TaxID=2996794 RepID=A0AAU9DP87_9FUSO|nr:flagellar basal body P-ring formation chaperone FlgA [Haliovirga abyssi]BDU50218.1 hypothetical protein HLVA_07870 [Haliovirga abyssi]